MSKKRHKKRSRNACQIGTTTNVDRSGQRTEKVENMNSIILILASIVSLLEIIEKIVRAFHPYKQCQCKNWQYII
ncbi:MAG: hypothetical protein WCO98_16665 [bacterium]